MSWCRRREFHLVLISKPNYRRTPVLMSAGKRVLCGSGPNSVSPRLLQGFCYLCLCSCPCPLLLPGLGVSSGPQRVLVCAFGGFASLTVCQGGLALSGVREIVFNKSLGEQCPGPSRHTHPAPCLPRNTSPAQPNTTR